MNKKYNKYDLSGEYGIGYASSGKEFYFDLEDYDLIKDICWNVKKDRYVCGWVDKDIGRVKMHMWIMNDKNIGHINKTPNDNRRNNLRKCSHRENIRNSSMHKNNKSGVIGVYFESNSNKWVTELNIDNINTFKKRFKNKEDAIVARLNAEVEYFGEFAPQKHLYEQYGVKERKEGI